MRKYFSRLGLLFALLYSFPADAFVLPPFKLDASVIGNEVVTYVNTTAQNASKAVQESTIIQTTISYGQGAKEAYEYATKMLNQFKGMNLNNLGETLDKMSAMEAEQSKTKEEAAAEIATLTKETNAKIVELDANIRELNKKIIEDPDNTKKYQRQIRQNEKEKDKLSKDLIKQTRQINKKTDKSIGKLNSQIKDLKGQAQDLVSSIFSIGSNYDSTEDLNQTVESLLPGADVELNTEVIATYAAIYRAAYFQTMNRAMGRAMLLKMNLAEDNEKAADEYFSGAEMEGATASVGMVVKSKAENIKALLNFTEILLQRVQLEIAHDLATGNFAAVDPVQAAGAFNLDNYRFTPPEESEAEVEDAEEQEELDELEEDITPTSGGIIEAGRENLEDSATE